MILEVMNEGFWVSFLFVLHTYPTMRIFIKVESKLSDFVLSV